MVMCHSPGCAYFLPHPQQTVQQEEEEQLLFIVDKMSKIKPDCKPVQIRLFVAMLCKWFAISNEQQFR